MSPPESNMEDVLVHARMQGTSGKKARTAKKPAKYNGGNAAASAMDPDDRLIEIRQRLAFLCHDLRTFSSNPDAARRLDSSVYTHFLGPPYLSSEDTEFVLSSPLLALRGRHVASTANDVCELRPRAPPVLAPTFRTFLEERTAALLDARRAKAAADGKGDPAKRDFVLCTSHDLAPLLQEACGLPKHHFDTRAFKDAYRCWEKTLRKEAKRTTS